MKINAKLFDFALFFILFNSQQTPRL